nr:retrovirus-related Pol polyprotein from transposon TNT 1-94 [Tanacetum cinerariifolium]
MCQTQPLEGFVRGKEGFNPVLLQAQKKVSPDRGPINIGDLLKAQAAPKANMEPPPGTTLGYEKSYFQNSKSYIILNKHTRKVEESLNVTFDETPPPSKTSPLVDDDLDEEEAIKATEKKNLENDIMDETLEIDEIVNIKESRNHPLKNVTENLNQRTLRSQAQNQKTKWVFRNKLDENGIVSRNKARLVAQGHNQHEGIDYDETYAPVARLESIKILLAYACDLDLKLFQMDVKTAFLNGFINEEVYVAQPPGFIDFEKPDHVYKLKKALYGLKQAPKAWPDIMFSVCLYVRFQEAPKTSHIEVVKRIFRYIKGTTHLGLWYPKRTDIETVVYADSDYVRDYVDRKSTSGHFVVNFVIQIKSLSHTLEEFGQFLKIPFKGHVAYTDMWLLDYLSLSAPSRCRYKTTPPSPQVIKSLIQITRQSQSTRTKNKKTIVVDENEMLTREIQPHMKPWVDIIHENAVCLGGHKDHVFVCLCHMLYCIESLTPYNLAFFVLKRMEKTYNKPKELLPYGMLLSRLFKHIVSVFPELAIDRYLSFDRVMHPLAPHYERKTRSDHGKKRLRELNASFSSSITLNHPSSSHLLDDTLDENNDESFHSNSSPSFQNIS